MIQATRTSAASEQRLTLDALSERSGAQLEAMYTSGDVPADLGRLDGAPAGRMLAVRRLERDTTLEVIRQLASASFFPWEGKSFHAETAERGRGVNRIKLAGRHRLFEFRTSVGRSRLDDDPAVILDYDLPENPGLIRSIHDEIREIEPGLFLGPAMWKRGSDVTLMLWFALDTHSQMPFSHETDV